MAWNEDSVEHFALGAALSIIVALIAIVGRAFVQKQTDAHADRVIAVQDAEREVTARLSLNAGMADTITSRFKTLMDSYENRIADMTAEITALREELRQVKHALQVRTDACLSCPHFMDLEKQTHGDAAS